MWSTQMFLNIAQQMFYLILQYYSSASKHAKMYNWSNFNVMAKAQSIKGFHALQTLYCHSERRSLLIFLPKQLLTKAFLSLCRQKIILCCTFDNLSNLIDQITNTMYYRSRFQIFKEVVNMMHLQLCNQHEQFVQPTRKVTSSIEYKLWIWHLDIVA